MINKSEKWVISYKQIGVILVSFTLGIIVVLLFSNSQAASSTSFTTTELISFVLTVILAGASIVLAITAIALGKSSEQAILNRNDESIRLQTEVFTKTIDALQGIKASTDVTEKRIEDIISGRAGDISKHIVELTSDETAVGAIDKKELEENIKKSIISSFEERKESGEDKKLRIERRELRREKQKKYEENHNIILYDLANKEDVKIIKLSHGTPTSNVSGSFAKYDAVFEKNNTKFAVSTFAPSKYEKFDLRDISKIVTNLAADLDLNDIEKLYLIFFDESEDSYIIEETKKAISLMKENISSKIIVNCVAYSEAENWGNTVEL